MPSAPPDPTTEQIRDRTGCQRMVGYVIDRDPGDGSARCWIDIEDKHLNSQDLLHGGLTATLLDVAAGNAASLFFDAEDPPMVLTLSLNMSYVSAVRAGRVTATGRATGGGRTICYAGGELRAEDGRLIATAAGVFKRVPRGRGR